MKLSIAQKAFINCLVDNLNYRTIYDLDMNQEQHLISLKDYETLFQDVNRYIVDRAGSGRVIHQLS